jgi:triacylglycerol lipase
MADGVLLIPGFLGFAKFGRGDTRISYFDHVAHAIQGARPELKGWVDVSEPPPTGSLKSRVQNLHDKILDVFANGIGGEASRKPDRLHLVGHSTGGVDARLLVNSRYDLPGADQRSIFSNKLGAVVTVSAPLHGSPIAARLNPTFRLSVPALYLLSIAAKVREVAEHAGWVQPSLAPFLEILTKQAAIPNASAIQLLLSLDATTAGNIASFLGDIVSDGDLIDDLKPSKMQALNATIADGDTRPMQHIVTVAPAPSFPIPDLFHPLTSLVFHEVYALLYRATADPRFTPAAFPRGPWLPGSDQTLAAGAPEANDGVVPAASQTLAGDATAIVEGDHLDVVGHFESKRFAATGIFKSDSGFDDRRFERLWRTVAQLF